MSSKPLYATPTASPSRCQFPQKLSTNKPAAHPGDSNDDDHHQQDIDIVKLISRAKFPVYLVSSTINGQNYALKVFDYENGRPHRYYRNEARFAKLDHPNIIKIINHGKDTIIPLGAEKRQASYIMMEYAPYGDFFDFVTNYKEDFNEKLARTYFRQLIEGLEYLHSQNVCHLDLKLENLLLGDDYKLKIADFDLSFISGDVKVLTRGTKYYRSPELKESKCKNGPAADVYAVGIILFVLKCGGIIPHAEGQMHQGVDLLQLLNNDQENFFARHCSIQKKKDSFFDSAFRDLFISMTNENISERATIVDIKRSEWYKGTVFNPQDLKEQVQMLLGK